MHRNPRRLNVRHRPQRPNRLYGLVYEIYLIGLLSGSRFYPIANRLPTRPDIYKISALYKSFTYLITYICRNFCRQTFMNRTSLRKHYGRNPVGACDSQSTQTEYRPICALRNVRDFSSLRYRA